LLQLQKGIISLFRKVTTSLPPDVESAIKKAAGTEEDQSAKSELLTVLSNVQSARSDKTPICEDTGVPFFYISAPKGMSHIELRKTIIEATRSATEKIPLPSYSVDPLTGQNTQDNTGAGIPVIHIEETEDPKLTIELMLLGTSSENLGQMYSLPDDSLGAGMDLEGIRLAVLDAAKKAGGSGCPPYIIGVGLGPTRDRASWLSKQQIRRKLDDENPVPELRELENRLIGEVNELGFGPKMSSCSTTALGVKIGLNHRHPRAAYLDVSLLCWNTRRGKLIW
jgi:fumarate hydratase class I